MSKKNNKKGNRKGNGAHGGDSRTLPVVQLDREMIKGVVLPHSSVYYSGLVPYRGAVIAEVSGDGKPTQYFTARAESRRGRTIFQLGQEHDSRP